MSPQMEVLVSVVLFLGLVFWVGKGIELGQDAYNRAIDGRRGVKTWRDSLEAQPDLVNYRRVEYERYLEQSRAKRDQGVRDFAVAFVWPLAAVVSGVKATLEVASVARERRKERA